MTGILEQLLVRGWNHFATLRPNAPQSGLALGHLVIDGRITNRQFYVPLRRCSEHCSCFGVTGAGKSSFLLFLLKQLINRNSGFLVIDVHGTLVESLLRFIHARERELAVDLSDRLIVVSPGDSTHSAGWNILDRSGAASPFVQVAEFVQILKERFELASLGPRTEELLRNSLLVLGDCGMTIVELVPLLTDAPFRAACLRQAKTSDAVDYFRSRFDRASEGMQGVLRDPVLNKISAFVSDPHYRHLLGQPSTFSIADVLENNRWVLIDLSKGTLGEHAVSLAALLFTWTKNAVFGRKSRAVFSIVADEVQNLLASSASLETFLSESRKYGIAVFTANQWFAQVSPALRSALLSVGTKICFRLSPPDAEHVAGFLDGGRTLAGILKNLPARHLIVKTGDQRHAHLVVPEVVVPDVSGADLYRRSQARWAAPRAEVERGIRQRAKAMSAPGQNTEVLNGWD